MSKAEFLQQIARGIAGLPQADVDRWLEYYTEMLEDRIEDGMSEEEAVASLGAPAEVVRQILSQTPLAKLIKSKVTPKRKLPAWEIVLLALGSPLWVAIGIVLVALFFSVFTVLWSCIAAFWAVELAFAVSGLGGILLFGLELGVGAIAQGFLFLGTGFVLSGSSYFGFFLCKKLTALTRNGCGEFLLLVKSLFVGKGEKK